MKKSHKPVFQLCPAAATERHLPLWSHCHQWFSSAPPSHSCVRMPDWHNGRESKSSAGLKLFHTKPYGCRYFVDNHFEAPLQLLITKINKTCLINLIWEKLEISSVDEWIHFRSCCCSYCIIERYWEEAMYSHIMEHKFGRRWVHDTRYRITGIVHFKFQFRVYTYLHLQNCL